MKEDVAYRKGHPSVTIKPAKFEIFADRPEDLAIYRTMYEHQLRVDQLAPAYEQWLEARQASCDRSGAPALYDRYLELCAENRPLLHRIARTRALTMSGIWAKLALIATDFNEDEISDDGGTSGNILRSIAVDYQRGAEALT
jgi:hypothetical protein